MSELNQSSRLTLFSGERLAIDQRMVQTILRSSCDPAFYRRVYSPSLVSTQHLREHRSVSLLGTNDEVGRKKVPRRIIVSKGGSHTSYHFCREPWICRESGVASCRISSGRSRNYCNYVYQLAAVYIVSTAICYYNLCNHASSL